MSSFSMQKLRSLLPGQHTTTAVSSANSAIGAQRVHSVSLAPEIGFQISIESSQQNTTTATATTAAAAAAATAYSTVNNSSEVTFQRTTIVPVLHVHLIAARHLPTLFGFKVVQGYLIKVKLFPGSKRFDSSIQTNSWPKFNETFKFSLAPDIKPSLKQHSSRRSSSKAVVVEFAPEELFAGHFVVFSVYALLELPPTNLNRFNKTYRSLRDKSSNLVQKMVESSNGLKDNGNHSSANGTSGQTDENQPKSKTNANHPRDAMPPPLTYSEARRNIGSVTCYLEPKIFQRNGRNGVYCTEELWLPIKDITSTVPKQATNSLTNSSKGVVEIVLELRDLSENSTLSGGNSKNIEEDVSRASAVTVTPTQTTTPTTTNTNNLKQPQWKRMTFEMKRKMQQLNSGIKATTQLPSNCLELRVITARMRCSNKVKDELEANAGTVYVKTSVFQHNILVDSWKSGNFYPSLSTKWEGVGVGGGGGGGGDQTAATMIIPLRSLDDLDHLLIRTTLATKTKMAKKLVLGTVFVGAGVGAGAAQQFQKLREAGAGERIAEWHCYQ